MTATDEPAADTAATTATRTLTRRGQRPEPADWWTGDILELAADAAPLEIGDRAEAEFTAGERFRFSCFHKLNPDWAIVQLLTRARTRFTLPVRLLKFAASLATTTHGRANG